MNIPKQCNKEITFMLYNYNNIDKIIEDRKEEIMDNMSVTNTAYLKSIKSKNSNTLEDIVMKFDSDKYIQRLKKWQRLINSFCNRLYDERPNKYYYFIKYKYFIKKDDVNVYRFAEYLKKFSKDTQFLVITHRKGTMEAADTVYGVTMEENGISKLLSMKLK